MEAKKIVIRNLHLVIGGANAAEFQSVDYNNAAPNGTPQVVFVGNGGHVCFDYSSLEDLIAALQYLKEQVGSPMVVAPVRSVKKNDNAK
jgi:hypothetical protein